MTKDGKLQNNIEKLKNEMFLIFEDQNQDNDFWQSLDDVRFEIKEKIGLSNLRNIEEYINCIHYINYYQNKPNVNPLTFENQETFNKDMVSKYQEKYKLVYPKVETFL